MYKLAFWSVVMLGYKILIFVIAGVDFVISDVDFAISDVDFVIFY